ncbi:hypothetical protein PAGU2595_010010 [Lysobacter xanthus]
MRRREALDRRIVEADGPALATAGTQGCEEGDGMGGGLVHGGTPEVGDGKHVKRGNSAGAEARANTFSVSIQMLASMLPRAICADNPRHAATLCGPFAPRRTVAPVRTP